MLKWEALVWQKNVIDLKARRVGRDTQPCQSDHPIVSSSAKGESDDYPNDTASTTTVVALLKMDLVFIWTFAGHLRFPLGLILIQTGIIEWIYRLIIVLASFSFH